MFGLSCSLYRCKSYNDPLYSSDINVYRNKIHRRISVTDTEPKFVWRKNIDNFYVMGGSFVVSLPFHPRILLYSEKQGLAVIAKGNIANGSLLLRVSKYFIGDHISDSTRTLNPNFAQQQT